MPTGTFKKLKIDRVLQLKQALYLVWQSGPGWTVAGAVLLVMQGMLPLLTLYLVKLVIDTVASGLAAPDKGLVFQQVAILIALTGLVNLVLAACNSLSGMVQEMQAEGLADHVHDILHAKAIEVDLEDYENPHYHDMHHHAQREAPYRPFHIVNGLVGVGRSGISLLAMTGLLVSFHWTIVFLLFAAVLPGAFVRTKYAGRMYHWQRKRVSAERRAWYFHWLLTESSYVKEIRLFALGPHFMKCFRDMRRQLRREKIEFIKKRSIAEMVTQASATLALLGTYIFIAYRTLQGIITLGDLVMYHQAFQRGQGFLREMVSGLVSLYENNLFLSSLYEFLDIERKVPEPPHPMALPKPMKTGIVFNHVAFQYPTGTRKVLEDVTLTVRPGEIVALVGENGSGKTTLIKLLCRLYDPTEGKISIDGIDLRRFESMDLRREISVVFQDYVRYNLTARENIWFGNIELPHNHKGIIAAATDSGADEVITELNHGYETVLGKQFEDGEELSIGEWQKLALARAFLRDAQIIVLDEPTSAMDAKAEYEVFQKFRHLLQGRAGILISHRMSTVRMADRVYMLENGRIIESGTHDELVCRSGKYACLFETQAQCYR